MFISIFSSFPPPVIPSVSRGTCFSRRKFRAAKFGAAPSVTGFPVGLLPTSTACHPERKSRDLLFGAEIPCGEVRGSSVRHRFSVGLLPTSTACHPERKSRDLLFEAEIPCGEVRGSPVRHRFLPSVFSPLPPQVIPSVSRGTCFSRRKFRAAKSGAVPSVTGFSRRSSPHFHRVSSRA